MPKTVLLTGATGFIGSHLLKMLLDNNYNVVILKRSTSNNWRINQYLNFITSYDIDKEELNLAFKEQEIDCVIHTATNYGRKGDSMIAILETNLMFSIKLLEACQKFKIDTFINTDTLLDRKLNAYSLSKKQFVDWLKQNKKVNRVVNLQLEYVYGPFDDGSKFINWFITQLIENKLEVDLTAGEQLRDFTHIDDIVTAYQCILQNLDKLGEFNDFEVGTGKQITVKEFLLTVLEIYRQKNSENHTKLCFGKIPYRNGEKMTLDLNVEPILSLGWKPTKEVREGILSVINSINE